jgi:hypothetical protein
MHVIFYELLYDFFCIFCFKNKYYSIERKIMKAIDITRGRTPLEEQEASVAGSPSPRTHASLEHAALSSRQDKQIQHYPAGVQRVSDRQ